MPLQLDLFTPPPPPPPPPKPPDPTVERLIALGLAPNQYILDLNRKLSADHDVPSRLFHWPVEFIGRERLDADASVLALNHPLLGELESVQALEELWGEKIAWIPEDEFGRDRGAEGRYFHAIDLANEQHWQTLVETRRFTDAQSVAAAAGYGVRYGRLKTTTARELLAAFKLSDPTKGKFIRFVDVKPNLRDEMGRVRKKPEWFINETWGEKIPRHAAAWAFIHGLEGGLYVIRSGHVTLTPKGIEAYGYNPDGSKHDV